jgi:hypothetical protein
VLGPISDLIHILGSDQHLDPNPHLRKKDIHEKIQEKNGFLLNLDMIPHRNLLLPLKDTKEKIRLKSR